jgi:hypothetical protein
MVMSFSELRTLASKRFGGLGVWTYDEWRRLNEIFFYGRNNVGPIVWWTASPDESLGYYAAADNIIYLNEHLLKPVYPMPCRKWDVDHMNKRLASDVILHEMIHQKIHQSGGWEGESSHNNSKFVAEVNRIAKLLGLCVKARVLKSDGLQGETMRSERSGYLTMRGLFYFPYASRPSSYYRKRNDTKSLN